MLASVNSTKALSEELETYAKSKISNRTKVQDMRETLYGTDN